jgi:DNA-binding beta-propeller fold protein YncE
LEILSVNGKKKMLVAVQLPKDSVEIFDLQSKAKIAEIKVGYLPHEITCYHLTKRCFVSNFGLQDYDMRIRRSSNSIG